MEGEPEAGTFHWLAALRHLALCDGVLEAEEQRILDREISRLLPGQDLEGLHLPGDAALVQRFGRGTKTAENFLRTALIVALADGFLSREEVSLLRHWSDVLEAAQDQFSGLQVDHVASDVDHGALDSLRRWLDDYQPHEAGISRFLVRLIPAQCPFARDITIFGKTIIRIPPMCKINPLYDQLMALRFRALCTLEEGDIQHQSADV